MVDQADTLRKLMQERKSVLGGSSTRDVDSDVTDQRPVIITVASGKGGVGKTVMTANLGALLARSGLRVLLVDGDSGLANLDIMLGVQASATLEQVLTGQAELTEAIVGVEPNLWLLPSSSGLCEYREAPVEARRKLIRLFDNWPWDMDVILMDLGAGIQDNVLSLHHTTFRSVIVLTPEPTSFTDAYGLIKMLRKKSAITRVQVVVNHVENGREGQQTFQRLKDVATKFVDVQLEYLGHIERDEKITQSILKRKILVDLDLGAPAVKCMELLAKRVRGNFLGFVENQILESVKANAANMSHDRYAAGKLTSSRFKDEPARMAPGNTARFVRALLGEVKI